jgi:two-component system, cell cycle sensor histidine kinase and response regulator CckA
VIHFPLVHDLTMPLMGGEATFKHLKALRNDVPVILSSGYEAKDAVGRFNEGDLAGF